MHAYNLCRTVPKHSVSLFAASALLNVHDCM